MIFDYAVEIDYDDDRTYTNGLCKLEYVVEVNWTAGLGSTYDHIANPAMMRIALQNIDGRYDLDNSSSPYYGKIHPGRLVRVRATYEGVSVTMTELRIVDVQESFSDFGAYRAVTINCMDKMREFLNFEYSPKLQQNVTIDQAFQKIHEEAEQIWPNNRSYFFVDQDEVDGAKEIYNLDDTDFETSRSTLVWVGDHLGQDGRPGNAQRFMRDLLKAEVFGMYFFQPRTGKYTFYNRLHASNETSQYTFRTDGGYMIAAATARGRNPYGLGPLNTMSIDYRPRRQGSPGAVIYTSENTPISIYANDTREIRGRYSDPDNEDADVAALDIFEPVSGIDYTATYQQGGGGADATGDLILSSELRASEFTIVVSNKSSRRIYIQSFQLRGTPLISYKSETVRARNDESFYLYDAFEAHDSTPIDNDSEAQSVADMMVYLYGTPRKVIQSLQLIVTEDIAEVVQTLTIGDRISVQNSQDTHNEDYMIVGENHKINIGYGRHEVVYLLRALSMTGIFYVDTSSIDGSDILDI